MEKDRHTELINKLADYIGTTPNYMEFISSELFRHINFMNPNHSRLMLKGKCFTITGDIRGIHIVNFDQVNIAITISNKHNGLCETTDIRVSVPEDLKSEVLKLKPTTGIELVGEYSGLDTIVDVFKLVKINKSGLPLYFPYCVCTGDNPNPNSYSDYCHRVLGYSTSSYTDRCPYCGSTTEFHNNVYSDKFKEILKSRSI